MQKILLKKIGLGGFLIVASIRCLADTIAPAAINDLKAFAGSGQTEVDLTFTSPGNDNWENTLNGSYHIQYSSSSNGPWNINAAQKMIPAKDVNYGHEDELVVAIMGDPQIGFSTPYSINIKNVNTTMADLATLDHDFLAIVGDLVQNEAYWSMYKDYISDVSARPIFALSGNAEYNWNGTWNFTKYTGCPLYYSIYKRGIRFIFTSVLGISGTYNHTLHLGSEQMAWLSNELAADTVTTTILFSHGPLVDTTYHSAESDEYMVYESSEIKDLINQHENVKLYVNGHVHIPIGRVDEHGYSHFKVENGVLYCVIGATANGDGTFIVSVKNDVINVKLRDNMNSRYLSEYETNNYVSTTLHDKIPEEITLTVDGIPSGPQYFRVWTQDESGNVSGPSDIVEATAGICSESYVSIKPATPVVSELEIDDFNDGDHSSWTKTAMIGVSESEGTFKCTSTSSWTFIKKTIPSFKGTDLNQFVIKLKSQGIGGVGILYWNGGEHAFYTKQDSLWHVYKIDLSDDPDWNNNTINEIRIHPGTVNGINFEIDWVKILSAASLNVNLAEFTQGAGSGSTLGGEQLIMDVGTTTGSAQAAVNKTTDRSGIETTFSGQLFYNFYQHQVTARFDVASITGTPGPGRNVFYFSIGDDRDGNYMPQANVLDNGIGFALEQVDAGSGSYWRINYQSLDGASAGGGTVANVSGVPTAITYTLNGTQASIQLEGATITLLECGVSGTVGGSNLTVTVADLSANISGYTMAFGAYNLGTVSEKTVVTLDSFSVEVTE